MLKSVVLASFLLGAIIVSQANSAKNTDPRICDTQSTRTLCAENAASIIIWKEVGARTGAMAPYRPACVPVKPSLLKMRCFLIHGQMFGAAGSVAWNASTFAPTVTFGPAAIAYMAQTKARISG